MDIQTMRLSSESFKAKKSVYIDVLELFPIYEELIFNSNLILVGPKGIGKSLSFYNYARCKDIPIVTSDCSEDMRRSQLIGSYIIRGGETPFVLGPVTTAFEVANEVGSCILLMEEVNALSPQSQKLLNPLADFRKRLEVSEAGKVFKLKKGAKLWVVGTMNFSAYGGVYSLNEDLKSRFRLFPVSYPTLKNERLILEKSVDPKLIENTGDDVLEKLLVLCNETRQGALEYALSTRDLIQIVEDAARIGLEKSIYISTGKFEDTDRDTYLARVQSILGIKFDS